MMRRIGFFYLVQLLAILACNAGQADGWTNLSPRQELRPEFQVKKGSHDEMILQISADNREGLDGSWTKTFSVEGGQYYRFHAFRRLKNVASARRSAPARIIWRDALDRSVRH